MQPRAERIPRRRRGQAVAVGAHHGDHQPLGDEHAVKRRRRLQAPPVGRQRGALVQHLPGPLLGPRPAPGGSSSTQGAQQLVGSRGARRLAAVGPDELVGVIDVPAQQPLGGGRRILERPQRAALGAQRQLALQPSRGARELAEALLAMRRGRQQRRQPLPPGAIAVQQGAEEGAQRCHRPHAIRRCGVLRSRGGPAAGRRPAPRSAARPSPAPSRSSPGRARWSARR